MPGSREAAREAARRTVESAGNADQAHAEKLEGQTADAREARDRSDRVELSERGRLFADDPGVDGDRASREAREQRIAQLRTHVQNGTLYTPERTEEAARRMLDG